MGKGEHQISKIPCSSYYGVEEVEDDWKIMDSHDEEDNDTLSLSSLDSTDGSSSSDMADDASTSSNSCSSSLYDLSELMSQLPIKRGLSKFYQGKSESFTSLSRVTSIEDLAKKQTPYRRKIIKSSKSYGGGLDTYKLYTLPKSNISKKVSRNSMISSPSFPSRRGSFVSNYRPPLIPVQKN